MSFFDSNTPPVADSGQEITDVLVNDLVTLNGSASTDEDIDNCTWLWTSTTHPDITVAPANSSIATFNAPETGTITFQLNLTDPQGLYSTSLVDVIVGEGSDPRAVIASPPASGPDGPFFPISTPIEFSANGSSDPDGREISFRWSSNISGLISTEKFFTGTLDELGWHRITLNVTDPNDGWKTESVDIKIREDLFTPVADLNIIPSRPSREYSKSEMITLDGTGTTDENVVEMLNYTWSTNVSGPRILGHGEILVVRLDEGYHNITLTVVDSDGLQDTTWDTLRVTNKAPRAFISPVSIKERDELPTVNISEEASFSATPSSDQDGDELSFLWDFGDGDTEVGENVSHSWSNYGVYNVTLTVDDGSQMDSSDSSIFTIYVNSIPTASIDIGIEVEIEERFTITANGSADEDGDDLEYLWDFDGDGQWDASGFSTTWKYADEAEYPVELRVSDGFAWNTITSMVKVVYPNERPVAAIANDLLDGEVIVTLNDDRGKVDLDAGASYDPDDDTNGNMMIDGEEEDNLTYTWDLDPEDDSDGDGIDDNDEDEEGKEVRVEMRDSGTMKVILNVSDPRGKFDTLEVKLRGNNPPESLSIRIGPQNKVLVGARVTFTGGARDPDRADNNRLEYYWDFGDGESSDKANFQSFHQYTEEGSYDVVLTVTDGLLETEARTSIKVVELDEPSLTYPSNNSELSGIVTFRGKIREVIGFEVDKVEIRAGDGEWDEADGTSDWTYDLNTARYPDGELKVQVRYTVDDTEPLRSSTDITIFVSNNPDTGPGMIVYLGVALVVIVLVLLVVYMLFIRRKPRSFEEYLPPPPPPPGRGPPMVPPGGLPPGSPMQNLPKPPGAQEPPKKEAPAQAEPPKPEEAAKPKQIRIKCPSCGKIFRSEDSGERPLHINCKHCGASGMIETVPGDEDEKEVEEAPPEEEEEAPDPIPIVCPSCSGLFELTEVTDTAKCPHCGVEGELDQETISLLEERFSKREDDDDELTLRCPTCAGTFKVKGDSGPIICPYCGAKGKAGS